MLVLGVETANKEGKLCIVLARKIPAHSGSQTPLEFDRSFCLALPDYKDFPALFS